jgi:hypothetical protein
MDTTFEDLRERKHLLNTHRHASMVSVERLVASENTNRRQAGLNNGIRPDRSVTGFVGGMPGESLNKNRTRCRTDHSAKEESAFEFALAVPVEAPGEV